MNSEIFGTPSLKILSFVVYITMSSVREFWEFWEFWDLTLSRAISAGHAAEETRKHVREVVQSQSTTNFHKINEIRKHCHQAPNEKINKCKFCNESHPRGKCQANRKPCLNYNWKNHFKVCCPRNRKKLPKIEQTESDCEESSDLEFFVETIGI